MPQELNFSSVTKKCQVLHVYVYCLSHTKFNGTFCFITKENLALIFFISPWKCTALAQDTTTVAFIHN